MNEENKDISYDTSPEGEPSESAPESEAQTEAQPEMQPESQQAQSEPEQTTQPDEAAEQMQFHPFGEGKSGLFLESLHSGKASVLFTPIYEVNISDTRLRDAFSAFINNVGVGESFRPIDIITAAESLLKRRSMYEYADTDIYCFDAPDGQYVPASIMKYSVQGVYSLFSVHNGILFDIEAAGGSIAKCESKRYILAPRRKAERLFKKCNSHGFDAKKCGSIVGTGIISILENGAVGASAPINTVFSAEKAAVALGSDNYGDYISTYRAVCAYTCCTAVESGNYLRFSLAGGLESVCARALGYFNAVLAARYLPIRAVFIPEGESTVAVPRPKCSDGDYVYLLKVRTDGSGVPDQAHHAQLEYYLADRTRAGIIKSILPLGENTENTIYRLCGESLDYVSLSAIPERCFGVVVTVPRGESVNGIKLGYFTNKV